MYCGNCGFQNLPTAAFCGRCGAQNAPVAGAIVANQPAARKTNLVRNIVLAAILAIVVLVGGVVTLATLGSAGTPQAVSSDSPATTADNATAAPTSGSDDSDDAPAGNAVPGTVVNVAAAPFKIDSCGGVVTTTTDPSGNTVPHLWVKVTMENKAGKTISATRMIISGLDAFGTPIDSTEQSYGRFEDDSTLSMDSGSTYYTSETFDQPDLGIRKISCTQTKAQFQDGRSWDAPSESQ